MQKYEKKEKILMYKYAPMYEKIISKEKTIDEHYIRLLIIIEHLRLIDNRSIDFYAFVRHFKF